MSDDVKALFRQKLASSQSKSLEALKAAKRAKLQKQARADAQQDAALQRKLAEKQRRDAAARAVQAQAEASRPSVRYVAPPEGRDHSQPAQQPATGRISDAKRARLAKVEKYKRPLTTAASKDSASKQEPAASSRQARDAAPNKGSTAEKGSVPAGFFDDSVQDAKVRKAPLPHETKAAEWAEFEKEIEKEAETTEAIIEADTNQTTIQRTLFELEEQKGVASLRTVLSSHECVSFTTRLHHRYNL
ncbi:uncharacterized protein MONBRDRAFT_27489 [Monosiga brevicollis MX1]|uniref:ZNF380 coiled-coil domain-containing protein n=1 Tax=Monosiga brevicollis TaxID=81824 RepID=A9V5F2_MONBE|nr:uncharacterized protein MONBRDRAFT_27489 [Monosiga brevicollis MX1]EDQ87361.1 predicted protein [Monosiga brevicollis MX1]|eukprot:XP_001747974.1 hypothetical protein [Monosiga brevicollis MX1]